MFKKFSRLVILLGCGLIAAACATNAHKNAPGWSYVKFDDPVCGQITLEMLNAFHMVHKQDTIPFKVWTRWTCVRHSGSDGRLTLVVPPDLKPYRLTLVFGTNGRVVKAATYPEIWQQVISVAMYARLDSLTESGHSHLAKYGSITFEFMVKPE